MLWKGFQRPKRVDSDRSHRQLELRRVFGAALRARLCDHHRQRVAAVPALLDRGGAITAIHIEGVLHEFSSLPGVVEDVTDIILNLRMVSIRMHTDEPRILSLDVKGPGVVTAGDLAGDPMVEIVDPDLRIATLNEEGHFKMQVQVCKGRGYIPAEKNYDETMSIGWIPVDSVHSPVRRVNYRVEPARVGRATDYERLTIEIHTNGTVTPDEALSLAAMLLRDHLSIFTHAEESMRDDSPHKRGEELSSMDKLLGKSIDELDLSVRSANCLQERQHPHVAGSRPPR